MNVVAIAALSLLLPLAARAQVDSRADLQRAAPLRDTLATLSAGGGSTCLAVGHRRLRAPTPIEFGTRGRKRIVARAGNHADTITVTVVDSLDLRRR